MAHLAVNIVHDDGTVEPLLAVPFPDEYTPHARQWSQWLDVVLNPPEPPGPAAPAAVPPMPWEGDLGAGVAVEPGQPCVCDPGNPGRTVDPLAAADPTRWCPNCGGVRAQ